MSTISNAILICKILSSNPKYGVGYILLLHLSGMKFNIFCWSSSWSFYYSGRFDTWHPCIFVRFYHGLPLTRVQKWNTFNGHLDPTKFVFWIRSFIGLIFRCIRNFVPRTLRFSSTKIRNTKMVQKYYTRFWYFSWLVMEYFLDVSVHNCHVGNQLSTINVSFQDLLKINTFRNVPLTEVIQKGIQYHQEKCMTNQPMVWCAKYQTPKFNF